MYPLGLHSDFLTILAHVSMILCYFFKTTLCGNIPSGVSFFLQTCTLSVSSGIVYFSVRWYILVLLVN